LGNLPPAEYSYKIQLIGKAERTLTRTGELFMKSELSGQVWECRFEPDFLLRGKDGVWTDVQGVVVARGANEVIAREGDRKGRENKVDKDVSKI
jgi:hypothetical protein